MDAQNRIDVANRKKGSFLCTSGWDLFCYFVWKDNSDVPLQGSCSLLTLGSSQFLRSHSAMCPSVQQARTRWRWSSIRMMMLRYRLWRCVSMCHPLRRMELTLWRWVQLEQRRWHRGGERVVILSFQSLSQAFAQNVLSKADVIQATGDAICIFRELQCLTPRGRYDIRIYPTFLHLHGKTFDYKIPYTTVLRLFLLPHKDQRQMFFVVRNKGIWGSG